MVDSIATNTANLSNKPNLINTANYNEENVIESNQIKQESFALNNIKITTRPSGHSNMSTFLNKNNDFNDSISSESFLSGELQETGKFN